MRLWVCIPIGLETAVKFQMKKGAQHQDMVINIMLLFSQPPLLILMVSIMHFKPTRYIGKNGFPNVKTKHPTANKLCYDKKSNSLT